MIAVIWKMRVLRIIFYIRDLFQDNSTCNAVSHVSFFFFLRVGGGFAKINIRLIQTLNCFSDFVVTGPNHASETTKPRNRRIALCKKCITIEPDLRKVKPLRFQCLGCRKSVSDNSRQYVQANSVM